MNLYSQKTYLQHRLVNVLVHVIANYSHLCICWNVWHHVVIQSRIISLEITFNIHSLGKTWRYSISRIYELPKMLLLLMLETMFWLLSSTLRDAPNKDVLSITFRIVSWNISNILLKCEQTFRMRNSILKTGII